MRVINKFFHQRIAVYTLLSVLAGLGVTAGCSKKPLTLHPPQVQSTGAQSGGVTSQTASAAETGGAIGSAAGETARETAGSTASAQPDWLVGIQEETLTESGAVASSTGSDFGNNSGNVEDGSSAFGGADAPVVGEGLRSGGLGDFAPGRTRGRSGKARMSKMLPFQPTRALDDVHFQFDKYDLDAISKSILQKNAQWLKQHPGVKLEIQGHTDQRGTNNYNLGLGERRAQSVKKYLLALGVDGSRLFAISYGEEKPFCLENKENCWWQNRRGHFMVSAPRSGRGEMLGMLP